ncbi:MAG: hypothetical protein Q9227_006236 [Pyrenula ochraceoflavens]
MASSKNRDPNTLSNYSEFRTVHTTANLEISFEKKCLRGNVVLQLQSTNDADSREVVLDSSFLDINSINVNGQPSKWDLSPRMEPYGSALKIPLPNGVKRDTNIELDIAVQTTDQCTALQWLTPAQTSNKKSPYMFSQCQAIHARSVLPCQDTPDVKSTFTFNITSPLPVIASGIPTASTPYPGEPSDKTLYQFEQKVPIPSYLFALASGDIAQAKIGPRSVVATGPDELEACKWEFEADAERFIKAAESIVYPYAWGDYNVLVLPPSFPYGGMENPVRETVSCFGIFTFATPTVVSGDRNNVDVIAHELSHSWSGNLVTSATWEHFWLNEGWTTEIISAIHGPAHGELSAIIGYKELSDSVNLFGPTHEFTKLVPDLQGKDPDDAFSKVPYEKGYLLLRHLRHLLTPSKFSPFIPHYFTLYRGRSLTTSDFKSTLLSFFADDPVATRTLTEDVDWQTWLYAPGLPPRPSFGDELVLQVDKLFQRWTSGEEGLGFEPRAEDVQSWSGNQKMLFLENFLELSDPKQHLPRWGKLRKMESEYAFLRSGNVEIKSRFLQVCLKSDGGKEEEVVRETRELLGRVGRMKFVRPLYRVLSKVDLTVAKQTFEKNRDFYHPICRGMVEKDLEAAGKGEVRGG